MNDEATNWEKNIRDSIAFVLVPKDWVLLGESQNGEQIWGANNGR